MSATESERNKLYNWFEENMGDANAEALMRLLPPVGWADVATKRDLDALERRIDTLATRIDTLATKDELHQLRTELQQGMRGDLQQMRGELQQTFVRWMFAAHGATVALLGLLIAATR